MQHNRQLNKMKTNSKWKQTVSTERKRKKEEWELGDKSSSLSRSVGGGDIVCVCPLFCSLTDCWKIFIHTYTQRVKFFIFIFPLFLPRRKRSTWKTLCSSIVTKGFFFLLLLQFPKLVSPPPKSPLVGWFLLAHSLPLPPPPLRPWFQLLNGL